MARVPPSASDHPPFWKFGYPVYHAATREAWRAWLERHQDDTPGVWVVSWRSSTGRDTVSYDAIVEEALCVGWIDSTVNVLDDDRIMHGQSVTKPTTGSLDISATANQQCGTASMRSSTSSPGRLHAPVATAMLTVSRALRQGRPGDSLYLN
jgi:hypothetical protein